MKFRILATECGRYRIQRRGLFLFWWHTPWWAEKAGITFSYPKTFSSIDECMDAIVRGLRLDEPEHVAKVVAGKEIMGA